ncbi:MAG: UPF0182 family protein [Syntrophothermus sp.]
MGDALRRTFGLILGAAAVFFVLLVLFSEFYTDWLWFAGLKYDGVFWKIFWSTWMLRLGVGLIFFAVIFGNLLLTRKVIGRALDRLQLFGGMLPDILSARRVTFLFLIASAIGGFLGGAAAGGYWEIVQKFLYGSAFGVTDPLFKHDIGYYIFTVPFYQYVYRTAMGLLGLTTVVVGAIYFLAGSFQFSGRALMVDGRARRHLEVLLALIFALKAWGYRLAMFNLLYSTRGVVFGAGYTDVHAQLLALKVLMVIALFCALIFLAAIVARTARLMVAGVGLLLVSSLVLGSIYPGTVQQFLVEPNEQVKERPYILENIKYTRLAYGLDKIGEKGFTVREDLTAADLQGERGTLQNVRLWDWRPLLQTYGQLQAMRLYYDFRQVDIDRYTINGELRQVMLAPREMNIANIPESARTWINMSLLYTHGYGLVMSPVNLVTQEGLPNFFIKNIPPESSIDLKVERPEIYFGELTNNYVLVNTRAKEFDYPIGDENAYTRYGGTGGVVISSPLVRAALAVRFGNLQLLLSNDITSESRALFYRNIGERVRRIAPFLLYDRDPYLVVDRGRLFWIQDAYVTTSLYPYSAPVAGWGNYVRNSVKVVIDAYNGTTDYYIVDPSEPLARTYASIFPSLFKPVSQMPEGLRSHLRYPEDLFRVQAQVYNIYHMNDPDVFYNKEDVWTVPTEVVGGEEVAIEPYYIVMKLPGAKNEEFVLMQPFTPSRKNNMIAWLAALSDGENYGKLLVYKFPKQQLTYGPMQIEARINQDSEISKQLTLWNQKGSRVIRGNLLVIPVKNSIMYVEPLYLQSEQSQMPELKRVIVAYGNQVVMETDFETALNQIFGTGFLPEKSAGMAPAPGPGGGPRTPQPARPTQATVREYIRQARQLFDEAQNKLRDGDWAGYGQALQKMADALRKAEEASNQ